jgi:hypothetical protein
MISKQIDTASDGKGAHHKFVQQDSCSFFHIVYEDGANCQTEMR